MSTAPQDAAFTLTSPACGRRIGILTSYPQSLALSRQAYCPLQLLQGGSISHLQQRQRLRRQKVQCRGVSKHQTCVSKHPERLNHSAQATAVAAGSRTLRLVTWIPDAMVHRPRSGYTAHGKWHSAPTTGHNRRRLNIVTQSAVKQKGWVRNDGSRRYHTLRHLNYFASSDLYNVHVYITADTDVR